jgi:hypothetical protein
MPITKVGVHAGGTLASCQAACEANAKCHYINFALTGGTPFPCYLFAACSQPWTSAKQCQCPQGGTNCVKWWTSQQYNRNSTTVAAAAKTSGYGGGYGGLGTAGTPPTERRGAAAATDTATTVLQISGGQQTGQQGSTQISGNNFYVENIKEEVRTTRPIHF